MRITNFAEAPYANLTDARRGQRSFKGRKRGKINPFRTGQKKEQWKRDTKFEFSITKKYEIEKIDLFHFNKLRATLKHVINVHGDLYEDEKNLSGLQHREISQSTIHTNRFA